MKEEKRKSRRNVWIYIGVFLFVISFAFFFWIAGRETEPDAKTGVLSPTISEESSKEIGEEYESGEKEKTEKDDKNEETKEDTEFAHKNRQQIEELRQVQGKLAELIPSFGLTGREFNRRLLPLIELLGEAENISVQNWEKFQEDFAYEYNKMYMSDGEEQNLPKKIRDNQKKIIEILQELNRIIQSMHK